MKSISSFARRDLAKLILLLLSIAGFFDASYLAILHYKNAIPPCTIALGCEAVLTSRFSTILGIPIALIGSFYFLTSILLLLLIFKNPAKKLLSCFKLLSFSGAIASIILIYIQAFILHAFCQYCLLNEAIIFAIFILSFKLKEKSIAS